MPKHEMHFEEKRRIMMEARSQQDRLKQNHEQRKKDKIQKAQKKKAVNKDNVDRFDPRIGKEISAMQMIKQFRKEHQI
jgi:hypothetical protein